jgi:hypothetical protein
MRTLLITTLGAALLLSGCAAEETTACGDPGGSTMCPGSDCLGCHSFKVAGTVFASASSTSPLSGATVTISPSSGADVVLTSNSAGNFYTSASLAFPLSVTVSKGVAATSMGPLVTAGNGGCNSCHDATQRIHP